MENKGLNKVDLIFEKIDTREVLTKVCNMTNGEIIQNVLDSGLKGRGGAGFPTGLKWKYTAAEKDPVKYIVCNADEGEPGTFKDREILDRVSNKVYGGMVIAGKAIGAKEGIVYLRGEYRYLLPKL
jgi:[NiFe] hydrogenase diaphorase moiety large subunit